jgi:hypothetical protein
MVATVSVHDVAIIANLFSGEMTVAAAADLDACGLVGGADQARGTAHVIFFAQVGRGAEKARASQGSHRDHRDHRDAKAMHSSTVFAFDSIHGVPPAQ